MPLPLVSISRACLTAALLAVLLAACADGELAVSPAPEVEVAPPQREMIRDWAEYTGRFAAVDAVQVRARVSGYLEKVHFSDGQRVQAGDLLFTIDPRPFRAAAAQQRASVQRAEADVALASSTARRTERLRHTGAVSEDQHEQRQSELKVAQAQLEAAQAALAQAELDLEFTAVRAPVAGRVSRTRLTPGNLVGTGSDGTVLTTLVSDDPLYFYFTLSEADALKLRRSGVFAPGQPAPEVRLRLADESAFTHSGTLDFVDNQIDASTGTVELRALLRNGEGLFQPGQFARVRIATSVEYEALLVPEVALGFDQGNPYVLVLDEGNTIGYRPVQLGGHQGRHRVVSAGLDAGERIVVNGLQRARPGSLVTPLDAPQS
jgi:RND family efflux transporter MFP subunit